MKHGNKLFGIALALAALPFGSAFAQGSCKVSLTQDPLVMRLGKDEFRIAFGLDAASCDGGACSGTIRYNATWEAEDGTRQTERRSVTFDVPEGAPRSLSVDRSYFDNGEAQHMTNVVSVAVDDISCGPGAASGLASR